MIRNQHRQDPTAVLKLCQPFLCDYLENLVYITHTIVPETIRFTEKNQTGSHRNILRVAVDAHGWLIFLCFDEEEKTSKILKAKSQAVTSVTQMDLFSVHVGDQNYLFIPLKNVTNRKQTSKNYERRKLFKL